MLSIHPRVKDFRNEIEKNYETDEINKENMKEVCIFIVTKNWKIQNIQQDTSNLCTSFVERRTSKEK